MMSRRRLRVGLAGVGLALLAGALVLPLRSPPSSRPLRGIDALHELRQRTDLNVLFVLVDTLRADHLSAYGYDRPTSPALDALSSSGVRFADVQAQSSWTKTSMASIFLGAYPARTGVLRHSHAIPAAATMPAEILKEAGFVTVGIWRNGWVANNFGFDQGFDVYYRPAPGRSAFEVNRGNPSAPPLLGTDLDVTEAAIEFLRAYRDERLFLYLHYMDVHQYAYDRASARFGARYVDAYDNAIHWTDRNLDRLVAEADRLGILDRTLVVLASDHGEAFREHGDEGHARHLYREVTSTPLLLWLPFRLGEERVVRERVENVDIWPTLLDLLGLPPLPGAQGRSLVPLLQAADAGPSEPERPSYAHLDRTWGRVDAAPQPLVSVTRGALRLFHRPEAPDEAELYDHATDPGEQRDLAAERPEAVARLLRDAEAYLAMPPAEGWGAEERRLDAFRLRQLRALGYVVEGRGP